MNTRWLVALMVSAAFLSLPATASAREKGKFGVGLGGVFNLTNTTNELAGGEEIDNQTLFLRVSPRAEYFVVEHVPIKLTMGVLTRSLDRGDTSSTELDGIFTLGTGYHLQANPKFAVIFEAEVGGYLGQSSQEITIGDQVIDESTDTKGIAFGGGLSFAYALGTHAQLRAGLEYTGLIGSEKLPSSDEDLAVSTHTGGLSLGFMYFF